MVYCDCARFEGGDLCKHVWATLLALDRAGEGRWVPGNGRLEIVPDYAGIDFDDDEDDVGETGEDDLAFDGDPDAGWDDELTDEPDDDWDEEWEDEDDDGPRWVPRDESSGTWVEPKADLEPPAEWRRQLGVVGHALGQMERTAALATARDPIAALERIRPVRRREVWFEINRSVSAARGRLVIDLFQREERKNGELGHLKPLTLDEETEAELREPRDRELARLIRSMPPEDGPWASGLTMPSSASSAYRKAPVGRFSVPGPLYETVLTRLVATGRLSWWEGDDGRPENEHLLVWDDGPAWRLALHLERGDSAGTDPGMGRLTGSLVRRAAETPETPDDRPDGDASPHEHLPLDRPVLLLADGLAVLEDRLSRLDARAEFPWIVMLRREGSIDIPEEDLPVALEELFRLPAVPSIELPDDLPVDHDRPAPRPRLSLVHPEIPGGDRSGRRGQSTLRGELAFGYHDLWVAAGDPRAAVVDGDEGRILLRDREAEARAVDLLAELGVEAAGGAGPEAAGVLSVPAERLAAIVERLLAEGWRVEAEGARVRRGGSFRGAIGTGVDWFELRGAILFGDEEVPLPRLLEAARRGRRFVELGDGSHGMLPTEWAERLGRLAELAPEDTDAGADDAVRFLPSQALLLDTLLAAAPEVDVDERFADLRQRLSTTHELAPEEAPDGFRGTLRAYQKEGLGWLTLLGGLGLGGCLADDMGLGKTIQVLALLEKRRRRVEDPAGNGNGDGGRRPTLVVAPRSLVYNWLDEASRFTPDLATLDYTGTGREALRERFGEHDLVITTYGTLRRDAAALSEIRFDYAILDEAQAIKNPDSQTAKAARLLQADHRLVLTGTPVENHLRELGSLFEFLNPGMLGRSSTVGDLLGAWNEAHGASPDEQDLAHLARALGPFILRRTKEEVLPELPPKTEQTLFVTLGRAQRELYDELKAHFRAQITRRIEEHGLNRSRMHVLEALLRLRQAACHPELLGADLAAAVAEGDGDDREQTGSAKLDTLFEQLDEVLDEGHKALVFSQFTQLLALVRRRLDRHGVVYEYLDGQTRNRKERVERFQEDADCRLFLISLKAGGTGLNLTAADYVFLLDPWWNPAVEAQAVDRAHRIGQDRPVIAYRLIARETVEEKILELQKTKRELADAVLSGGGAFKTLSSEDLELLLS
jgi:superfamily II DNA or RNA helicase